MTTSSKIFDLLFEQFDRRRGWATLLSLQSSSSTLRQKGRPHFRTTAGTGRQSGSLIIVRAHKPFTVRVTLEGFFAASGFRTTESATNRSWEKSTVRFYRISGSLFAAEVTPGAQVGCGRTGRHPTAAAAGFRNGISPILFCRSKSLLTRLTNIGNTKCWWRPTNFFYFSWKQYFDFSRRMNQI